MVPPNGKIKRPNSIYMSYTEDRVVWYWVVIRGLHHMLALGCSVHHSGEADLVGRLTNGLAPAVG